MTRATELDTAALEALNAFLRENQGRAPRLLELAPADWEYMRDFLKDHRAHGFIVMPPVALAKTDGRENFVLYGLPVVAGGEELKAGEARAVAT